MPDNAPAPIKPERLIVLETEGWNRVDASSHETFAQLRSHLEAAGISITRRCSEPSVDALETSISNAAHVCGMITAWENRWALRNLINRHPRGVSQRTKDTVTRAETMSPDDYRELLRDRE